MTEIELIEITEPVSLSDDATWEMYGDITWEELADEIRKQGE